MAAVVLVGGDDSARCFACERAKGGEELLERLRGPGGRVASPGRRRGGGSKQEVARRDVGARHRAASCAGKGKKTSVPLVGWASWLGCQLGRPGGLQVRLLSLSLNLVSVFYFFSFLF